MAHTRLLSNSLFNTATKPVQTPLIERWQERSTKVLAQLITPEGIFASSAADWQGSFHAYFGRDSAITASLVMEAERLTSEYHFSPIAISALMKLGQWQGRKRVAATGEEVGKLPHEIRTNKADIQFLQQRRRYFEQPAWFVDSDHVLKNWDSSDATPLWIISLGRWAQGSWEVLPVENINQLHKALTWCLKNLAKYDGLSAYVPVGTQPGRTFGGLVNQGWKDSAGALIDKNGQMPSGPIYDVLVNGEMWAALLYGADLFAELDPPFAKKLRRAAKHLQLLFNHVEGGFRIKSKSAWYYAEALDGQKAALPAVSADVGLLFWAYHNQQTVVAKRYRAKILKRLLGSDLFNPNAGIRTYATDLEHFDATYVYHRGPNTYWPFANALIIQGLDHLGYKRAAGQVAKAMLAGLDHFDSCVELFAIDKTGKFDVWHSPSSPQVSAHDQAWTAAAAYYATAYLQSQAGGGSHVDF